ncbi:hypothetical protein L9F63_018271 [Diploptera punctata]|uniref:peptidylprolyl isomerase n=1 Tax=Diploptera punctata TaxID=6984 RepID=A0AAD7ZX94_DIPPU|nr:hypothetical protein L9F63_018271 [Diploptera punctata]
MEQSSPEVMMKRREEDRRAEECGWSCKNCSDPTNLHLHVEIENLKQKLLEREHHIVNMETNFLTEAEKFPNGEFAALTEELLTWQEKYSRLYESHKRVQKVNQSLEDKLLKIVDKCETEKSSLTKEVANLTQKLVEANGKINRLQDENERYRNDVNLAIQLLQCKPANFVSHKFDMLPSDLQQKVRTYVSNKRRPSDGNSGNGGTNKPEPKTIKVPIPTFPPTAMVYSINKVPTDKDGDVDDKSSSTKPPVDIVSAAIMAKVLEERERERLNTKHCDTCSCPRQALVDTSTQISSISDQGILCSLWQQTHSMRCDGNVNVDASVRASQGLVRYVDVVATRNSDVGKNTKHLLEESQHADRNLIESVKSFNGKSSKTSECYKQNGGTSTKVDNNISTDLTVVNKNGKFSKNNVDLAEGRTYLSDVANNECKTSTPDPTWTKYSSDTPLTKSLKNNDAAAGPRHCSLRLQAGSSNILLDNATSYAPADGSHKSVHAIIIGNRTGTDGNRYFDHVFDMFVYDKNNGSGFIAENSGNSQSGKKSTSKKTKKDKLMNFETPANFDLIQRFIGFEINALERSKSEDSNKKKKKKENKLNKSNELQQNKNKSPNEKQKNKSLIENQQKNKTPNEKQQQQQQQKNKTPNAKQGGNTPHQQKTPGNQINGIQQQQQSGKKNKNKQGMDSPKVPKTPGAQTPGKKVLEGGVVVEDLKTGNGPVAKPGRQVSVYYVGRLKNNNKQFDSTTEGPGFKFRLGRGEVIKGWDIGLNGMKVGGKRKVTCPAALAYGNKGSPPAIPPNSTLVFDVELRAVN